MASKDSVKPDAALVGSEEISASSASLNPSAPANNIDSAPTPRRKKKSKSKRKKKKSSKSKKRKRAVSSSSSSSSKESDTESSSSDDESSVQENLSKQERLKIKAARCFEKWEKAVREEQQVRPDSPASKGVVSDASTEVPAPASPRAKRDSSSDKGEPSKCNSEADPRDQHEDASHDEGELVLEPSDVDKSIVGAAASDQEAAAVPKSKQSPSVKLVDASTQATDKEPSLQFLEDISRGRGTKAFDANYVRSVRKSYLATTIISPSSGISIHLPYFKLQKGPERYYTCLWCRFTHTSKQATQDHVKRSHVQFASVETLQARSVTDTERRHRSPNTRSEHLNAIAEVAKISFGENDHVNPSIWTSPDLYRR